MSTPTGSTAAIDLLRLLLLPGLGPVRATRVLERFGGSVDAALGASPAAWMAVPGIGRVIAERALREVGGLADKVDRELALMDRAGVTLLAAGEPGFPPLLAELPDSPALLFVRGRLEVDDGDRYPVAIVGSRRCTQYGLEQAERFAGVLGRAGLTVVSGGARGIDAAAHRGSLRSGGRTIAVQGCGLGVCYPPEHAALYDRIVGEGRGGVVSELPMQTEPKGEHFPARNRIISGLSLGVLVIEAANRSGALITARLAVEGHGREVMVVPGRVDSPASAGSLSLLKQGGATLVTEPGDVLDALEAPARFTHQGSHGARYTEPAAAGGGVAADPDAAAVLAALANGPATFDELVTEAGIGVERVRVSLTLLELGGRVSRAGGRFEATGTKE